jgi:integrase
MPVVAMQVEHEVLAALDPELQAIHRRWTGWRARATFPIPTTRKETLLQEHNVRTGFFERDQFEAVRRHLPAALQPLVTVAYHTGWRVADELLPMRWSQVDLAAGTLRLEPGTTKNAEGRLFYMTPELRACLTAQKAATDQLQRTQEAIIPFVFHRDGQPILDLYDAWDRACLRAGCPDRLLHDFRRTAVRDLERAGVSHTSPTDPVDNQSMRYSGVLNAGNSGRRMANPGIPS